MKKSQVLAALALAFALGVVAPVANTVVTTTGVSAYNTQDSTATFNDTTRALAFVEENGTYKAYVQIQDAKKAYNTGITNGTIADLNGAEATPVLTAIDGATARAFGYDATKIRADVDAESSFAEKINIAVKAAQASVYYQKIAAVVDLLENSVDNQANNGKLVDAVTALRTYTLDNNILNNAAWDNLNPQQATINSYKVSNPLVAGNLLGTDYTQAKAIFDAVTDANKALKKYNAGYDLFMPLLQNSGLLTEAANDTINSSSNLTLAALNGAANDTNLVRGAQWNDLYEEVKTVKQDRVQEESGDNYRLIRALAIAWQGATGNEQPVATVMERMVKFNPNTNDGSNKEDNAGNNQNKAPNTGALTNTEGSASTTVAMVAGIATALTAAGAGVVAYRNARRSTRK